MKGESFRDLILQSLKEKKWSQKRLADEVRKISPGVDISQPILSNWVTGRPPSKSDPRVPLLGKILGVALSDLLQGLEVESTRELYRVPTIPELLLDAQVLIEEIGPSGMDLWLLNADDLPVLRNDVVRHYWARNLARGLHYHIIWILDSTRPETIVEFEDVALSISELTREEVVGLEPSRSGTLFHYPTTIHHSEVTEESAAYAHSLAGARYSANSILFKRLQSKLSAHIVPLHHFYSFQRLPIDLRARLDSYVTSLGAVACYDPRLSARVPEANFAPRDLAATRDQVPINPILWLARPAADQLRKTMREIAAHFSSQETNRVTVSRSRDYSPRGRKRGP